MQHNSQADYQGTSTVVPSRVGNFQQKNYSTEDGIGGTIGLLKLYSDGIPAVPRNAKLSEFRSEPFRERELLGIPYCGIKIEAKLSVFRSEPFRGR